MLEVLYKLWRAEQTAWLEWQREARVVVMCGCGRTVGVWTVGGDSHLLRVLKGTTNSLNFCFVGCDAV